MQRTMISVGISFPKTLLEKIDNERQDIPRSKYILRIIERLYVKNEAKEENNKIGDSHDSRNLTLQHHVSHFRKL